MANKTIWTESTIISHFKNYSSPNEARTNAYGAWKAMKRLSKNNPQLEIQALSHMKKNTKWNHQNVEVLLKEYSSFGQLREENNPLYFYLWRLNKKNPTKVNELTSHFIDPYPNPVEINIPKKALIKSYFYDDKQQTHITLSPSIKMRIKSDVSSQLIKESIFDNSKVTGFVESLGNYSLHLNFSKKMIHENSLGRFIILEIKLITSHRINPKYETNINNLIIRPYIDWLQLYLPECSELIQLSDTKLLTKNV